MRNILFCAILFLLLSGCVSPIDHSGKRALAESYVRAAVNRDYAAMVEAWSPVMRQKLRKFRQQYNCSEEQLAALTLELGGSEGQAAQERIANDPAEFERAVDRLAASPEVTGDSEEGFVFINGRWYLQFY